MKRYYQVSIPVSEVSLHDGWVDLENDELPPELDYDGYARKPPPVNHGVLRWEFPADMPEKMVSAVLWWGDTPVACTEPHKVEGGDALEVLGVKPKVTIRQPEEKLIADTDSLTPLENGTL